MSYIRREDENDNLLFNIVFNKFERIIRLVVIKDKWSIFAT
jgi:hypothetical protein